MRKHFVLSVAIIMAVFAVSGCGAITYKTSSNLTKSASNPNDSAQASFTLRDTRTCPDKGGIDCNPKKKNDVRVLLAFSGGGLRAALFSALSMFEMQEIKVFNGTSDLLSEVDLISSVSGGSLAAGYYVLSGDLSQSERRTWDKNKVIELMTNNYVLRWFGNWFWPDNIALYWLTNYDRSDIMAQTLADNLFDRPMGGLDFKFSELNPARPNLVLNATKGSGVGKTTFGQPFTFTKEDFSLICSSINEYSVARGVMATAAFPGAFNFMTLTNNCAPNNGEPYIHVFDGGNADNLGLTSIKRVIWNLTQSKKPEETEKIKIIVVSVDAFADSNGVGENDPDPRHWYDYVVDTDFITATDSLLVKNRDNLLNQFSKKQPLFPGRGMNFDLNEKLEFVHISFNNLPEGNLRKQLNHIKTDFKISEEDAKALSCAVPLLFGKDFRKVDSCKDYTFPEDWNDLPEMAKIREKWQVVTKAFNERN